MQFVKVTYVTRFRKFQEFRPRQIITTKSLRHMPGDNYSANWTPIQLR